MSTLFSAFILSTLTSFMDSNFFLLWLFFFFTCLNATWCKNFFSKRNENLAAAYIVVPFKSTGRFPEPIYHQQIMCKMLSDKKGHLHNHTQFLMFHSAYIFTLIIQHLKQNISCYFKKSYLYFLYRWKKRTTHKIFLHSKKEKQFTKLNN